MNGLDHWDGVHLGYFQKIRVRVQTLDGDVAAWLYVLNDYEGGLPSARYLGIVADAAEMAGAPADYVAGLRARPCVSSAPAARHGRPRAPRRGHPRPRPGQAQTRRNEPIEARNDRASSPCAA